MKRGSIDAKEARSLRDNTLMTWKEIGIELAKQAARRMPYTPESVRMAVARLKKSEELAAQRKTFFRPPEGTSWCTFCKINHPGGSTCMGHYP